jgi:hypothetical protein
MIMLFWPLIAKLLKHVLPGKPNNLAEERPVE